MTQDEPRQYPLRRERISRGRMVMTCAGFEAVYHLEWVAAETRAFSVLREAQRQYRRQLEHEQYEGWLRVYAR